MTAPHLAARERLQQLDDRWRDLPLRTRLTSAAVLAATITVVAVVAVAYVAVRHELRGQVDKDLRQQVADVRLSISVAPNGKPTVSLLNRPDEPLGYVQVFDSLGQTATTNGEPVVPVTAQDLSVLTTRRTWWRDATINQTHVRMLSTRSRVPSIGVMVAAPLAGVDNQLHTLRVAFFLLILAGLALTVLVAWGAVRRTLRPVQSLTETAEQIAETRDLTLRIESAGNDELGRLAASFNTMLDALERSLAQQRQLVMDASHELRTPLASLRTNVEVLNDLDRLTPAQRKALLAGIVSQLEELTGLVADVVELARGDAPASTFEDIAWDDVVERALERARRHWPALTFRSHTSPVVVRGVVTRLERAVANMLDNAGKFSPAASVVDVELTEDGVLTVADRGPGVPDDALPHVFDRFFRADEARALPGSGLGLAIVKQVVDSLGGTIELHNRPDGGAVATMTLPVAARPQPDPAVPLPVEQTLFQ
jgi:two-component system sensor histidine kinase MprB